MSKIKVKTIYLIAIIVGGLIGLSIKSTYAMFTSSLEIDNPICMSTNLSTSDEIVDTMEVTVSSGETKEVPITINNTSSSLLNYTVFYNSSSTDIETGINMSNTDSNPAVGTINSNTTKKVYAQLKNNSSSSITVTVGVVSSSMSTDMNIFSSDELTNSNNLAEYITNLYTTSTKSTATVNNITYNLASSANLMNDRKGSSSIGANLGNIRYYGANPNNYIYFNCSDYSNQNTSNCEVWRIIGVFDNKVKIMRGSPIGNYSWDNAGISGTNNWTSATIMKLLNPNYTGTGGSLYYNSGSGACYSGNKMATIACNFTSTGLKNDETRNLISETTWTLLGHSTDSVYVDDMYYKERTTGSVSSTGYSTSWAGKVALAYPSDYGYAVDLGLCKDTSGNDYTLTNYSQEVCKKNNWMKNIFLSESWLLTPDPGMGYWAWYINSDGGVSRGSLTANSWATVPVLYLNADLAIESGNSGSGDDPFKLVV